MALDVEAARAAVQTIADAMSLSLEQAADGILSIVNENMAGALRARLRAARPRPARLRARRLRRRRPAARERGREADGQLPRDRAARRPACCARSATSWPTSATSSRARSSAWCARRRRTRSRASSRSSAAARATWMDSEGIAEGDQRLSYVADMRYHGQGYEIPVALDAAKIARGRPRRPRGALQRAARAALRLPHARHRERDREPARDRQRRGAEARAADRDGGRRGSVRRRRRGARDPVRGRERADAHLRPLEAAARARASRARPSSRSSTRPRWCCPATRPRSTSTSTS